MIEECLQEIRLLPLHAMTDEEFERKVDQLRQNVICEGSTYIQALLS